MCRLNTNLYKIKLICDNNNHGTLILPCRRPPIIIWKCKWSTRDIKWVWCGWRVVLRNELFRVPHSALSTTDVHRVAANKGGCAASHTRRNDGGAYALLCVYVCTQTMACGWAVKRFLNVGISVLTAVILWLWGFSGYCSIFKVALLLFRHSHKLCTSLYYLLFYDHQYSNTYLLNKRGRSKQSESTMPFTNRKDFIQGHIIYISI